MQMEAVLALVLPLLWNRRDSPLLTDPPYLSAHLQIAAV